MNAAKDAPRSTATNGPKAQPVNVPMAAPATVPAAPVGVPFEFVRRFADQMDRLLEDFGLGWHLPTALTRGRELFRRETGLIPAEWSPKIDVLEEDGRFVVRADLPGVPREDIKVEVAEGMVSIQGERKHAEKKEDKGYYYNECRHGNFYRAIPLPEGAEILKATAEYRDGVLEVAMPAPTQTKKVTRRLEIREN